MSASQVVLFAVELFRSPVIGLLVLFAMESRYSFSWNCGTLWCGISSLSFVKGSWASFSFFNASLSRVLISSFTIWLKPLLTIGVNWSITFAVTIPGPEWMIRQMLTLA